MRYPIHVVAQQTGISPATLRAWEQRYNGIIPDRSETGRRLYSEELLHRLRTIAGLLKKGYRIGDVADLDETELARLDGGALSPASVVSAPAAIPEPERASALAAARRGDVVGLTRILEQTAIAHGQLAMADHLVFPLLARLEELVGSGEIQQVHRSMAEAAITAFLYGRLPSRADVPPRRRIAIVVPHGCSGVMGAIASLLHVVVSGWYPIHLGTNVAGGEIGAAVYDAGAAALLLSMVTDTFDDPLRRELHATKASLPEEFPCLFGGRLPPSVVSAIEELGFRHVGTMDSLREVLVVTPTG